MIAQLGMYDRPETAAANDRFWSLIRMQLDEGPATLTRDEDFWNIWHNPDLLFSQTCGMPYRTRLHGLVQLIGTPDYGLPGCPPGYYYSVLVAHKDKAGAHLHSFEGAKFAYNEALSQSGWAAPICHFNAAEIKMGTLLETGGHLASAQAVAEGRVDIAGLDALTWELIQKHDSFASDLTLIARTKPTPTLPFVTSQHQNAARLFAAVTNAIDGLTDKDRDALHLKSLVYIKAQDYLAIPTPKSPSEY